MLKREGWEVNAKRIYRLYTEEGLIVRTQKRRERAQRQRIPSGQAIRPNQKWSMDFVAPSRNDMSGGHTIVARSRLAAKVMLRRRRCGRA